MSTYVEGASEEAHEEHQAPQPSAAPTSRPDRGSGRGGALRDVLVVLAWFVVAGVVAGLVWWQATPSAMATTSNGSVVVEADQLGKQVATDGWFFVVSAVGGLASGLGLLAWRRRDPLLMVALVTAGGGLASYLTLRLGALLGPGSEIAALRGKPDGAHAPLQLELHASGMALVFPIAAALGALIYLWVLQRPDPS